MFLGDDVIHLMAVEVEVAIVRLLTIFTLSLSTLDHNRTYLAWNLSRHYAGALKLWNACALSNEIRLSIRPYSSSSSTSVRVSCPA